MGEHPFDRSAVERFELDHHKEQVLVLLPWAMIDTPFDWWEREV